MQSEMIRIEQMDQEQNKINIPRNGKNSIEKTKSEV